MEINNSSDINKYIFKVAKYFIAHKKILLVFTIAFIGIGVLLTFLKEPKYTGRVTFALESKDQFNGLGSVAAQFGFNLGSGSSGLQGDNLIYLIESDTIIKTALLSPITLDGRNDLLINHYVHTSPKLKKNWDKLKLAAVSSLKNNSRAQDSAIYSIIKDIKKTKLKIKKLDPKASFVEVRLESHSEAISSFLCEQIVVDAKKFYLNQIGLKNSTNLKRLERRIDSVKAELNLNLGTLSSSQDFSIYNTTPSSKVNVNKNQLNTTLLSSLYGELVKNVEITKTLAIKEEPSITIIDVQKSQLLQPKNYLLIVTTYGCIGFIAGFLAVEFLKFRKTFKNTTSNQNVSTTINE